METKAKNFWWVKSPANDQETEENPLVPKLDLHSTSSVADLLEDKNSHLDSDVDVGSIIEEINRVAAQSPLGPYEKSIDGRSVDDLIKEAEKIYLESSKSFEQLSQRSRTSQNLSDLLSNLSRDSTPTPKSVSPLPMDPDPQKSSASDDDYTEDFSEESKIDPANIQSPTSTKFKPIELVIDNFNSELIQSENKENIDTKPTSKSDHSSSDLTNQKFTTISKSHSLSTIRDSNSYPKVLVKSQSEFTNLANNLNTRIQVQKGIEEYNEYEEKLHKYKEDTDTKQNLIENLESTNDVLKIELQDLRHELQKAQATLKQTKVALSSKTLSSPEMNQELEKVLENLKDSREKNTSLQLQLDTVNKSHQLLKSSYDDLYKSNKNLERRLIELDCSLDKYKNEILTLQQLKDKLIENEANLNKLLEIEKLQGKSIKLQNEKDAKCIQDLNRQIKEMERIIARKHPDSVSALIVAAKENASDTNLTARKILEDRIKSLEQEQHCRESQSSKVFIEIQEKFNQMKAKYENHIEDLEVHVKDLKHQLKRKGDTYDVYTQTHVDDKIPQKETFTIFTQTDPIPAPAPPTVSAPKPQRPLATKKNEDSHLLATIRGLQNDLTNKEKVVIRLQKEIDDLKKTNRRLQKEREGSLKSLIDKKESKSFPDKLSLQARSNSCNSEKDFAKEERVLNIKSEKDKLKIKLNKLQDDYQSLQTKRIQDLTALQEAHEQEVSNYISSISPLREQLEINQLSISSLQSELTSAKEELTMVTIERDHLSNQFLSLPSSTGNVEDDNVEGTSLLQKIGYLEKQYVDREYRLRTMIQNLAQKNIENRSCEQCSERQQQLISYKAELDQILPSVRALQ